MKKKILLVTRNFPPLVGGMEKLNLNICQVLNKHFDVSVSGPSGSFYFHHIKSHIEFPASPLLKYVVTSLLKTLYLAIKVRPHIVFCGSGAAILAGYFASRLTRSTLICYLHGLDIIADSRIYQAIFLPLIKKADILLVNSKHTCHLAIAAGINIDKIKVLSPGTDLPDITSTHQESDNFKSKYSLNDNPIILIAGRITKRKGIKEFIEKAMPQLVLAIPQLTLIIIGDEAKQAMQKSKGVKDDICEQIELLNLQSNVKLLGGVDNDTLSTAFFAAEMLVFPVLDLPNDVEGFGMVAIEAAAHGLPTVGFAVGGVPDAISQGSGWLVEPGHYEKIVEIIIGKINGTLPAVVNEETCITFSQQFSWNNFERKIIGYLEKM